MQLYMTLQHVLLQKVQGLNITLSYSTDSLS
jgi:hypothetical protein